jgi:hypothetical protein
MRMGVKGNRGFVVVEFWKKVVPMDGILVRETVCCCFFLMVSSF